MPNKQKHRGLHSLDLQLFSEKWVETMREAVKDVVYLLNRGFAENSVLKIVGDRYRLQKRQRQALMRAVCTDEILLTSQQKQIDWNQLSGKSVVIDAYNLLITTESALSDGIILHCKDGCYRDIASVHGTYRKVAETLPAIRLIGQALQSLGVTKAHWFLDSPISNSGRLKQLLLEEATQNQWNWEAELVHSPDKTLVERSEIVISSDSWVVTQATAWTNFQGYLITEHIKPNNIKKFW